MKNVFLSILCLILLSPPACAQNIRLGTTFSAKQCEYLDLDWQETYLAILDLPLDIIRLGAYWDEIEADEGRFDYSRLDWQIKKAQEYGIPVVLTVGIKAPRWPEYHIPEWVYQKISLPPWSTVSKNNFLKEKALIFIRNVMNRYAPQEIITHWQVENEALNRFGGYRWQMDKEFLKKEVELIRSLDTLNRPIILTASSYPNRILRFFADLFTDARPIHESLALSDILGINIYPLFGQSFLGNKWYFSSRQKDRLKYFGGIYRLGQRVNKDIWVTELQAEPWEPDHLVYKRKDIPPTGWSERTKQSLDELYSLGYRTYLFWGAEYWYFQKTVHQNPQWWDDMARLIISRKNRDLAH